MWTRAQLKAKAKYTFKLNYWKIVAVTLLIAMIAGGLSTGASFDMDSFSSSFQEGFEMGYNNSFDDDFDDDSYFGDDYYFDDDYYFEDDFYYEDDLYYDDENLEDASVMIATFLIVFVVVFILVLPIAIAISLVWTALIHNPIEVGSKRFFFKSLNEKAEMKEMLYAFDNNYKNVAKVMFFKTLYEMLWSLLFVIPGIVKGYEYKMIPYLLAENPNLTKEQAFALSKQMMDGNKWDAFVLDLSFIGWDLLASCTLGILSIFYVEPYKNMTYAALYEELSLQHGRPAFNEPVWNGQQYTQATYSEPTYNENIYSEPTANTEE